MTHKKPQVSIIFPAKNEGENVQSTLDSLFNTKTNIKFETIIVDDGSTDGCCDFLKNNPWKNQVKLVRTTGVGAANARNSGSNIAEGEYLIFCDAHLNFENWWIDRLLQPILTGKTDVVSPAIASITEPDKVGYGMSLNHLLKVYWNKKRSNLFETAVLPGGCLLIPKKVFNDVGGFESGFKTWGHEDVELSIKLWLFGYRCTIQPNVKVFHLFRKSHPYHVSNDDIYYNLLRLAYSHFNQMRIQKCKKLIKQTNPLKIEKLVIQDGVKLQRQLYFEKRKFDDNWYFNKFNIPF
ncbi:glycosyltransferase [Bacillus aquiflavi]|uniref:Glycosyltransferase n=1 Tax=Bacillus aquiflavi TaxID=2672567 RepID=A0A6B3VUZ1_9BACI|nr:glycosyltransferase [Bacillus aquiflavi]MBA4536424.1 glycosyltransferase [Bacillus aquiflavi]NEY80792.1 glycosyltransferase [Bacillus aquiflavi]UAC49115.1 glycosyltransferase [Bacillus aquiflavi]